MWILKNGIAFNESSFLLSTWKKPNLFTWMISMWHYKNTMPKKWLNLPNKLRMSTGDWIRSIPKCIVQSLIYTTDLKIYLNKWSFICAGFNQSTESADGLGGEEWKTWKEIAIATYCYVFIVKKLNYHIKNSKYYETGNWKTGGHCWPYISQVNARAHKYTWRHEESKEILTAGLGRNILKFLPYYIEKYVNVQSTSIV